MYMAEYIAVRVRLSGRRLHPIATLLPRGGHRGILSLLTTVVSGSRKGWLQ